MAVVVNELLELSFGLMLSIAFDEACAAVVLSKNRVQVLGFVGQTVVRVRRKQFVLYSSMFVQ